MDALRAQLDEMMGKNRNGDLNLPEVKFTDPEVCKNYLCGLCAHELYTNTKKDLGPCDKIHDPKLKEKYEEALKQGKDYDWDLSFERYLDKLVVDLDSDIRRANDRLKRTQGDENIASGPEADKLVELSTKIAAALTEAEAKGEEGLVDESKRLMDLAEDLKREHRKLEQQLRSESGTSTQKLKVCEICGAYLNLFDSDTRFTDHFEGKIHKGCEQIRVTLKKVKDARLKKWEEKGKSTRSGSPDRRSSRDRRDGSDREGRERSRDRDRDRSRDRDRDRERERDRDRHRERERDRDRDRDYRDRDRDRGSRNYDRRDRDRDRDRYDDVNGFRDRHRR